MKDNKENRPSSAKVEPVVESSGVEGKLKQWFPDLSEETLKALFQFYTELLKFNKSVNLISQATVKTAESVHVADCVLAGRLFVPKLIPNQPLYDFGSGNGCPGVILAAVYPSIKVILVDRDSRKLEFCKHVASVMGLKNLSVLCKSVEELPERSVVNAIARGFAPLPRALLVARKTVAMGGKFFHMKGDGWANELASVPSQLFTYWGPSLIGQYKIPDTFQDMAVVLTDKVGN